MKSRNTNESLKAFFLYAAVSGIGTIMTTHFDGKEAVQIISEFGYRYAFGVPIGIVSGLGWMFGQDLYVSFKTKKPK